LKRADWGSEACATNGAESTGREDVFANWNFGGSAKLGHVRRKLSATLFDKLLRRFASSRPDGAPKYTTRTRARRKGPLLKARQSSGDARHASRSYRSDVERPIGLILCATSIDDIFIGLPASAGCVYGAAS
jgi:hypothetical protein